MEIINTKKVSTSSEFLRAISHPLRLTIMTFIDEHKVVNVNKIYNTLKIEQSITSQHLQILRNADIVIAKREGKLMLYSLNYEKIEQAQLAINLFLSKGAERIEKLEVIVNKDK